MCRNMLIREYRRKLPSCDYLHEDVFVDELPTSLEQGNGAVTAPNVSAGKLKSHLG